MIIDEYGCLLREQNPPWDPGRLGSSCADTARYQHLQDILGEGPFNVNLYAFKTDKGFVDHPKSIWREDKFNSDSALPLFLATKNTLLGGSLQFYLKDLKTGDGKWISPGLYFLLHDNTIELKASLLIQAMLFKLPYRWSDSKKWFERTTDNSGDYLNYIHLALHVRKSFVSKKVLKQKVRDYWLPKEPNINWLIDMYDKAIEYL